MKHWMDQRCDAKHSGERSVSRAGRSRPRDCELFVNGLFERNFFAHVAFH